MAIVALAFPDAAALKARAEATFYKRWDRAYGGLNPEFMQAGKETKDGGFVFVGKTMGAILPKPGGVRTSRNFGQTDLWIVRTGSHGELLWERCYGGSGEDWGVAVEETPDGGFIVAGTTTSPADGNKLTGAFGNRDYWVLKLNAQGDREWESDFGGKLNDLVTSLVALKGGDYLVCGTSDSAPEGAPGGNKSAMRFGQTDYWVVKIDAQGQKIWDRSYGSLGPDYLAVALATEDGGALLGGNLAVTRIDAAGKTVWDPGTVHIDAPGRELTSMQLGAASSGQFFVSLIRLPLVPEQQGVVEIYKLNAAGTASMYRAIFDVAGTPKSLRMLVDPDGTLTFAYYLSGGPNFGGNRYTLLQIDPAGDFSRERVITGDPLSGGLQETGCLLRTQDGELVFGASIRDQQPGGDHAAPLLGDADFWALKFGRRLAASDTPQILVNGVVNLDNPLKVAGGSSIGFSSSGLPNAQIFFTQDGSVPDFSSHPASEALVVGQSFTLRAIAYSENFNYTAETGPIRVEVTPTRSLTTSLIGEGTIYTDPPPPLLDGGVVFVQAVPGDSRFRFMSWGGDLTGAVHMATLLMDRDRTISAEFEPIPKWTINFVTDGGGSIIPSDGAVELREGSLTGRLAKPNAGWNFIEWTGGVSETNAQVTVEVDRSKTVEAVFGTTVSVTSAGEGTILKSTLGPWVPFGSTVRLTPVPVPRAYFALWGNAAAGNTSPLDIIVTNPAPTVSALFATLPDGKASVTAVAVGSGRVDRVPAANLFNVGDGTTLTATPDVGQVFLGWAGDANGTTNPLTVTVDSSKLIYARFTPLPTLTAVKCNSPECAGALKLILTSVTPGRYALEVSERLNPWSILGSNFNETGQVVWTDSNPPANGARYYRARFAPLP